MAKQIESTTTKGQSDTQTADDAAWHQSRYNIFARIPGKKTYAVVNLFTGSCVELSLAELYLLSVAEDLNANHPILQRFARAGLVCKYDELAFLESLTRSTCSMGRKISLVICPTLSCNFDCPYCFEHHGRGRMSQEVQDDVVSLAERMLEASEADELHVTWFGGEPLLAHHIVASLSERLISLASAYGAHYDASIFTNAYLLTQEIADMLAASRISRAQVTIDGIGDAHDRLRPLAGGGPTFDWIVNNLRSIHIPFKVMLRQNVNAGSASTMAEVRAFAEELARESGNDIVYHPVTMVGSAAPERESNAPRVVEGSDAVQLGITELLQNYRAARAFHCEAQSLGAVCIDDEGRLIKCWEGAANSELAFGTAHDWDPANPLATATDPDKLTMYLNSAVSTADEECRSCMWLPVCAGGCPQKALFDKRECVPYKDDPEACALALYNHLTSKR
ncbi:MAG: radical SAM protein [Atopobiaceae bacterium]|nr:radical SAM protein [Atopobiaceae bacterium]